ncbi:MAG: indole-3-glycerol-phosphate synthase [Methanolobus sp.]
MHSVINNIVSSTEKRVRQLPVQKKEKAGKSDKRDIIASIKEKKSQNKVAVIAEVKPASPGKKLRDISPEDASLIASEMEKAGAVAISVLTEPEFFMGSVDNLKSVRKNVSIPVLRKDFIIHEAQFYEVTSDLILLIAGILEENLKEMVDLAISKGFEPLVEVHNEKELEKALQTNAKVIESTTGTLVHLR